MTTKMVTFQQKQRAAQLIDRIGVSAYRDTKRAVFGTLKPFQSLTYEEAFLLLGYLEAAANERIRANIAPTTPPRLVSADLVGIARIEGENVTENDRK